LKGAISRRRASSEYSSSGRDSLSSVDAILAKNLSSSAQVNIPALIIRIIFNFIMDLSCCWVFFYGNEF
jgi:hypothetical protein